MNDITKVAVNLARGKTLNELYQICESQKSIKTSVLRKALERLHNEQRKLAQLLVNEAPR